MMSEANPNNTQEPQRDTLTQTLLELVRALKNVAVAIGVLLEPIIISIAKGLTRTRKGVRNRFLLGLGAASSWQHLAEDRDRCRALS